MKAVCFHFEGSALFDLVVNLLRLATAIDYIPDTREGIYALITKTVLCTVLLKASSYPCIFPHAEVVNHISFKEGLIASLICPSLRIDLKRSPSLSELYQDSPYIKVSNSRVEAYLSH